MSDSRPDQSVGVVEADGMPIQPNKSMFMRAEHTPASAWTGHIPFAGWLVEAIEPSMLVELGTHNGTSYLAFCQAVEANGLATRCFAVDTWEGDEHAGVYNEDIYAQLHGYHAIRYGGFSRLMRMTFDDAVGYFDDGSIDLLHIDGLHTYDAVRHDFETWLPKLSRRGVIIFHDTFVREREFGVWRFWGEVSKRYPSFEFTHTHGLGVLAIGEEIPAKLRGLLETAGEGERLLVNQMFESLGRIIDANSEIERLNRALSYEQALRRDEQAAGAGESLRDEVRVGVDVVRRDIVSVRDQLLVAHESGQGQAAAALAEGMGGLRSEIGAIRDELLKVNAIESDLLSRFDALSDWRGELRSEIGAIRDELLKVNAIESELLSRFDALSDWRGEQSATLATIQQQADATSGAVLDSSTRIDSLAETMERLEVGLGDLQSRGMISRLRRLVGRMQSPEGG